MSGKRISTSPHRRLPERGHSALTRGSRENGVIGKFDLNRRLLSVRDIVLMKPSMQFRPCILKDLAGNRKPLRVGTNREIFHERL